MERDCIVPDDLLVEILSRIPVSDLLRLRCVCKSWCALIDDVSFIRKHYQVQCDICRAEGAFPLFLPYHGVVERCLQVHLLPKHQGDQVVVDLTADLVRDSETFFTDAPSVFKRGLCLGIVNGIVCIYWGDWGLGLWNPATREFKAVSHWLPVPHERLGSSEIIGFGFDPASNDFKIVAGNGHLDSEPSFRYELYSLATSSWKRIRELPGSIGLRRFTMDAHFNGACYWTAYRGLGGFTVLSFNFRTEVFQVCEPPEDAVAIMINKNSECKIQLCMDSLALILSSIDSEAAVSNVDIFIVTKFDDDSGVPSSWQHFYTVGQIPAYNGLLVEVDALLVDGNLLVRILSSDPDEEESSLYNPSTGTFRKLGASFSTNCSRNVETLFPLSRRLDQPRHSMA